ncbi:hypothetical protein XFF6992_660003 [Xanthomonas citri pv. fuscans]|nr:hypothetical protein XFF6992_660003 [Xanthomonas citri pv. fuscans]
MVTNPKAGFLQTLHTSSTINHLVFRERSRKQLKNGGVAPADAHRSDGWRVAVALRNIALVEKVNPTPLPRYLT